jgi:hypothetical protein
VTEERKAIQRREEIADEIMKEYQRASATRGNFESHWLEIAQRMLPSHSTAFGSQVGKSQGEKRNQEIFDSTAAVALNRFAAILDSLLTPRNQTWHRLMPADPQLNKNREVRLWFEQANRLLFKYRYAPKANFSSQNQQNYLSLGAYGSGCLFVDQLAGEPGLRYRNIHLGQVYFVENHQGIVDKVLRYFPLTARQAHQKWGDKLPDKMKAQLAVNPDMEFYFIHCVKPSSDYDPSRLDVKGKFWGSYYVSVDGKVLMDEGGYNSFPYAISRYMQVDNEVYGRSPAMDVLPAVKTLNQQKKTLLKQGHRIVDPVLLAHDDGILDTSSVKPGKVISGGVDAQGRPLVHALPTGRIDIGKELMDDERMVINDAFLINIFQILTETPSMTATEVMERTKEKGILLAPTIGRQQSEYLGPMIEREIDVLMSQGLLPQPPEALKEAGHAYDIEYDSPLSRSQRAEEAAGVNRTVEAALAVVNVTQNPEPLDHFDWDKIIPAMAEINGVPDSWMRDPKDVAAMRQGRAEQAQAQTAIQAAPGAAAMTKAMAVAQRGGK